MASGLQEEVQENNHRKSCSEETLQDDRPEQSPHEAFRSRAVEEREQFLGLIRHTQSVTQRIPDAKDTSGLAAPHDLSGPRQLPAPGVELEALIRQLVPPGSLTWRVLPGELPWTTPPGGVQRTSRPPDAVLHETLQSAGVKEEVARDYVLNGPFTDLMVHSPSERLRNYGRPARAIEVAAEHDISGRALVDLASLLSLTDHQMPIPRHGGTTTGESRGGRRYLSLGRKLLHALGVWPWAHVEDWTRTRQWWRDPAVFAALRAWHDKAWMRAAQHLAYNARARYGQVASYVISVQEHEACLDFRRRLGELGAERRATKLD
jgi:hypothetical protein